MTKIQCLRCGVINKLKKKNPYCEACGVSLIKEHAPNLIIRYLSNNEAVKMVTRIVITEEKQVYRNGDTHYFVVPYGEQIVVLKMRRNHNQKVYISNKPVTIYASFNGKQNFVVDQPITDFNEMDRYRQLREMFGK